MWTVGYTDVVETVRDSCEGKRETEEEERQADAQRDGDPFVDFGVSEIKDYAEGCPD